MPQETALWLASPAVFDGQLGLPPPFRVLQLIQHYLLIVVLRPDWTRSIGLTLESRCLQMYRKIAYHI